MEDLSITARRRIGLLAVATTSLALLHAQHLLGSLVNGLEKFGYRASHFVFNELFLLAVTTVTTAATMLFCLTVPPACSSGWRSGRSRNGSSGRYRCNRCCRFFASEQVCHEFKHLYFNVDTFVLAM